MPRVNPNEAIERRRKIAVVTVSVLAVVAVLAIGLMVVTFNKTPASGAVGPMPSGAPTPTLAPNPRIKAAVLRPATKVMIFGDSWTVGTAAASGKGYADDLLHLFHWDVRKDAITGTGYIADLTHNGVYPTRMAKVARDPSIQLLLIQGSVNDSGFVKQDPIGYQKAALRTWRLARQKFPAAQIVVVGPLNVVAKPGSNFKQMDAILGQNARAAGYTYVSGMQENWFNASNIELAIDKGQQYHPTTLGHSIFAQHLAADLKADAK